MSHKPKQAENLAWACGKMNPATLPTGFHPTGNRGILSIVRFVGGDGAGDFLMTLEPEFAIQVGHGFVNCEEVTIQGHVIQQSATTFRIRMEVQTTGVATDSVFSVAILAGTEGI